MRPVVAIDRDLVQRKAFDARQSPRRREIHVFHSGDEDSLHRMLNAIQPRQLHPAAPTSGPAEVESLVLLQGTLGYVSFGQDGVPEDENFILLDRERGVYGCDIRPGVCHTIFALAPDTVIFEVKPGPYSPASDKDFAAWAPPEYTPEAAAFLADIEDGFRRVWGLPPRSWEPPATSNDGK